MQTIILRPPLLSSIHLKEKITCIRGHRERLFRIEFENYNSQLIFHNYGQGGAGWTFLFGCVYQSIAQFEILSQQNPNYKNSPIIVLGAGCYGLLTATLLASKGYQVSIVAAQTHTTSHNAAGFFFPRPRKVSTPQEAAVFYECGSLAYQEYLKIAHGIHPLFKKGARLIPAYFGLDIDPGFSPYIEQELMQPGQRVTISFDNKNVYQMMRYQALFIDVEDMMYELQRHVRDLAVPIHQAVINSFNELDAPLIFNCSGYGARFLTDDKRIVPVQGHLITLQNQPAYQLPYLINVKLTMTSPKGLPRDELLYFAPKNEGILGITFLRGQDSLTNNVHEFDRIMERAHKFFGT